MIYTSELQLLQYIPKDVTRELRMLIFRTCCADRLENQLGIRIVNIVIIMVGYRCFLDTVTECIAVNNAITLVLLVMRESCFRIIE